MDNSLIPIPNTELKVLSNRQRAVLQWMMQHAAQHGRPPTVRQIGEHFKIVSPNGVMSHIKMLVKKGWITRDWATACGTSFVGVKFVPVFEKTPTGQAVEFVYRGGFGEAA